nr:hypothetical protein [Candidatus Sigynarchaeota archaeon]
MDLKPYAIPGYNIYKADVNITNNYVTAITDWVHVSTIGSDTNQVIQPNTSTLYMRRIGQRIDDSMRYRIDTISTFVNIYTRNNTIPFPEITLWNNATGGTTKPGARQWGGNLPRSALDEWINSTANYVINASAAINKTWFVVIDGTNWGTPKVRLGSEAIYWYADPSTPFNCYKKEWSTITDWASSQFNLCLKYSRLYLNDSNSNPRRFSPRTSLTMNGTVFDINGRTSITGTNITMLRFVGNVTSVNAQMTIKLYYRKNLAATQGFSTIGGASIPWNITSNALASFPSGTKTLVSINITKAASWTVIGVYNAATLGGLPSAANYTNYSVINDVIKISNIGTNSYWQLRATSPNRASSIAFYIGNTPVVSANKTNVINFRVNFASAQTNGNMTLGVYNPSYINTIRAFGTSNASFGGSVMTVTFPADWTIGQNVVGNFRVQARWNTTTEAGFISTTFLVLGRMNIGLSSVVQYGSPLSQLGGRYQGQYGDNIEMNYDMTDANNGSAISNLAYTFTTNGTPDASNTTSLSTLAQPLPFATRAVNNYSVVVTFQRTYYHNYTATVNIEIDKCPTTVILQYIRRSGVSLYQNGSGIYFTNTSTFTVTYEYRNSRTDALITSLSNADVYEGTHHFTSSSSTGTFDVNVNPASLATGVVLNFQASANNTNYLTSQALFQLVVDNTTPMTNIIYTPACAPNFVTNSTAFTLSASDPTSRPSGVKNMYYRIGGSGGYTLYSGAFNLLGWSNGSILIEYYSIDNANNVQAPNSTTVKLDLNKPTSSINNPAEYAPNWVDENATFVITANDGGLGESGVASTYYRLNAGGWMPYAGPFTLGAQPNGTYTISYYSIDRVGNNETVKSATFRLDKNDPVSSLNDPTEYAPNWVDENATFVITAADAGTGETGIASTYYRLNAGGWTPY